MLLECIESKFLTPAEMEMLQNPEGDGSQKYISKYLTDAERNKISTGPKDEIIIALVKTIRKYDSIRFKKFDDWFPFPEYFDEYREGQISWLEESKFFCYGDEDKLLVEAREEISPRYRAFFVLKYPEKVHQDRK